MHIVSRTFHLMRLFYRSILLCHNYFELAEQSRFKMREIRAINEMSSNYITYRMLYPRN